MKTESTPLPPGWTWTTLGDVCSSPQYGYTTSGSEKGDLRLLRTTDITSGQIDWDSVPYCKGNPDEIEKYLLKDGDIVVSRAGSVGVSMLLEKPRRSVFASYLIRFRPFEIAASRRFFYFFLKSPYYWNEITEKSLGIALLNVNASKLKEIPLPLPPLPEQHRIVEKIEVLFSELDKGVEQLKTAQQQLKVYRQSVLKWAFEGKLTEEWRKRKNSKGRSKKGETAEELVQRIRREREEQAKTSRKKLKPIAPLTEKELAELPELPEGWMWVRFSDVVDSFRRGPFGSTVRKEFFVPSGFKVYEQQNAIHKTEKLGRYFITRKKFEELGSFAVQPGDYIVSCSGTMGRIFRLPPNSPGGIINQALLRIRILPEVLSHKFFTQVFESAPFQKRILKDAKGTAMVNIAGIPDLELTPFPICLAEEQDQVVEEIETRLSVCDKLEETIAESLRQSEALRQSILKKAFEGKLVPQDPSDEPAEELLERIKEHAPVNLKALSKAEKKAGGR